MRIISKYQKLNKHALHAKLKTASHRFALMVDNYSPDDTEAENGLLMVTGKVFVPGYTDATVTIVYPKRKRSTDQSFYYITPTESTEDMSLAYSDDTFYPRFSECEQAVKDLPEVTVSQYFYDKGIIPDDPSTFTALTGIPLESDLVEDINEITGEDTNYYTIGETYDHFGIDEILEWCAGYKEGDQIIPYVDITSYFIDNGTATSKLETDGVRTIFVSPTDFYNSLTIILRQPSEHPELNTPQIYNDTDWCITITSTFTPEIQNISLSYKNSSDALLQLNSYVTDGVNLLANYYMRSLYSSLDEWASLVINGVLQPASQMYLSSDLKEEYVNVCMNGNPWTSDEDFTEFTIKTRDLEGFTPVEGLGNGVFHFVWTRRIEDSLSHFSNPTYLNDNPNDNQLYLTNIPNPNKSYEPVVQVQYSTVYFASNKRGREIVFLHLPDSLMSGCLDTAPSWATLNYLKTQGQQLMNCLQETIMSLSNTEEDNEPAVVDENTLNDAPSETTSNDLMSRLVSLGWEQISPTTIISPTVDAPGEYDHTSVKLQFTCIDNTWSLSSLIVSCEATGGEVPLPLSDTQLNEGVTSDGIEETLESIANHGNTELKWNNFRSNSSADLLANGSTHDPDRGYALYAARQMNRDIHLLSVVDPEFRTDISYEDDFEIRGDLAEDMEEYPRAAEWIYRILEAFNLPHSFKLSPIKHNSAGNWLVENADYTIRFGGYTDGPTENDMPLKVNKRIPGDDESIRFFDPQYKFNGVLWSDLFNGTPYADFFSILPGVGVNLKLMYVFSQPLLDDPQIVNNVQRGINREYELKYHQQEVEEREQEQASWLSQVAECMNQSQVFEQADDTTWERSTDPIVINGVDYSQQMEGLIKVEAVTERQEINIKPAITMNPEADDFSKYVDGLIPPSLAEALDRNAPIYASSEKIDTLIGHNILNGITTAEQLSVLEENTNDILPWLSNSSAQQVKALQNAAGWIQYCDKILNREDIPSLDFIKQGLHGNILNLLNKNNVTGNTGINDYLVRLGAVPLTKIEKIRRVFMEEANLSGSLIFDINKYYALPVKVGNAAPLYCALIFTKQNGKPVCQIEDNYLCVDRGNSKKYRFMSLISDPDAHFTTIGETFNNLVTGAGIPNYNLMHFLRDQLADGLQISDAGLAALEKA